MSIFITKMGKIIAFNVSRDIDFVRSLAEPAITYAKTSVVCQRSKTKL